MNNKYIYTAIAILCLAPSMCLGELYTVCSSGCDYTSFSSAFSSVNFGPNDILEARATTPGGSATFYEVVAPGPDDAGDATGQFIIRARSGDTITIHGDDTRAYGFQLANSNDYITIDGFYIRNAYYAQVYIYGINASTTVQNIIVQNCDLYIYSSVNPLGSTLGFFLNWAEYITMSNNNLHIPNIEQDKGNVDGWIIRGNNITIDGNTFLDENPHDEPVGGDQGHNDGIQVIGGRLDQGSLGFVHDFTISNNLLARNTSASEAKQHIYLEYEVGGTNKIFNNVIYNTTGSTSNMVSVYNKGYGTQGNFYFYGNTLKTTIGTAFLTDGYVDSLYFKNNIVDAGSGTCVYIASASVAKANIENNQYYTSGNLEFRDSVGFKTFAEWQAAGWDDEYSNWSDPDFVSEASYPYNLSLNLGDPAIDDGAILGSPYNIDILGVSRPQGLYYDIGAYEYGTPVLTIPTGVHIGGGIEIK